MTEKKTGKSQPNESDRETDLAVSSGSGLASIFEDFFRPFDQFFQSPLFPRISSSLSEFGNSFRQPILDIQDRGDHFSVTAELPGFSKDEVEVKVDGNGIELKAQKTEKRGEENKESFQRSTRSYYQYLTLPEQVVSEKIDGTMKNGILQLSIPKRVSKLKDDSRKVDLN